jgi:hypothetical protein
MVGRKSIEKCGMRSADCGIDEEEEGVLNETVIRCG